MDLCSQFPNIVIGNTNITWQAWSNAITNLTTVSAFTPSYLRPDTAGALLPWVYTSVILVIHLPVVVVRVVRWQAVQYWCLVSTLLTVVTYAQAYISTRFDAAKVLVWTPLILVIDAGSMLQVFFLVVESKKDSASHQTERCARYPILSSSSRLESQGSSDLLAHYPACKVETVLAQRALTGDNQRDALHTNGNIAFANYVSSNATAVTNVDRCWYRNRLNYAAVVAALLFIVVLILQLLGLVKAVQIVKASPDPPLVSWCSPLFQPFGLAAVDGSCSVYRISQSAHKGIGCITLPGEWQQQWLKGTIAGISIELCTELVDLLILSLVNGKRKIFQAVKLKRPWATIFSGLIVLIVTLIYGVNFSLYLPPGVTDRVTVLMDVQGPASYTGNLTSAGLRGAIIAWNDGLFESWRGAYFGSWST